MTWRDARNKDARLFETSAQLLAEKLQRGLERNDYFLGALRERAQNLDDTALLDGRLAPPAFDSQKRLPHLLAFGFAAPENGQLKLRWRSAARAPLPAPGEILPSRETYLANGRRLFVPVAERGGSAKHSARGSIVGWVDLESLCRDDSIPMIHDHVLTVVPLGENEALPANARRATLRDAGAPWGIAIARGERFSEFYGPPAPWLAFVAVGLSTVPLLVLASLAGRAAGSAPSSRRSRRSPASSDSLRKACRMNFARRSASSFPARISWIATRSTSRPNAAARSSRRSAPVRG